MFHDLPDASHIATASNATGGEERLYRTPAGEWFIRQPNRPNDHLSEDDVIEWLGEPHDTLVSKVGVERFV